MLCTEMCVYVREKLFFFFLDGLVYSNPSSYPYRSNRLRFEHDLFENE